MFNVFSAPGTSDDKSLVYLNQIFGSVNGIIQSPEAASGATVNTIGAMFQYFNSVILAVGALIVVYITVVGVLATAHEGEFMGKKWNNIWIPIRTVFGIAALVPMGGGYSALQMIMMWVIVQGIGAANNLWNVLLVSVSTTGSMYANATIPITGTYTTFGTLFEGLVCDATARITYDDPTETDNGGYFCTGSKGGGFCSSPLNVKKSNTSLSLGPGGQCGMLTYCDASQECSNSNSINCVACKAQVSALNAVVATFAAIAQQFAVSDYSYRDFYVNSASGQPSKNSDWSWINQYCQSQSIPQNECCIPNNNSSNSKSQQKGKGACSAVKGKGKGSSNFPDLNRNGLAQNASDDAVTNLYLPYALQSTIQNTDFIYSATSSYTDTITTAVNAWIIDQAMQSKSPLSNDLAAAQSTGWIFAGAYYYAVSEMNNNNLKGALPSMAYKAPDITSNDMNNYRNNYMAATTLANQIANGNTSGTTSNGSSQQGFNSSVSLSSSMALSGITSAVNTSVTSIQTVVNTNLTGSSSSKASSAATPPNPLVQLQSAGMALLLIAMILFAAFLIVGVLVALFSSIDIWALGTGAIDPAGPAFFVAMFIIIPAFFAFLGILITIGGLLGVYTPLIPYVVFSMGAIGWMLSVMETMVAGPLVALGILSPSGQHELLGKAEPGLMLLFNVFLRPILMIFGLATAMLLAGVAVEMINYAFWSTVVTSIGGEWNILELIIYLGAYVFLIVTVLNKCFSAIHVIPEKVIRWIGGQPESYGEAEALGEVKRGVESTTAGVKSGTDMTSYATKSAKGAYKRKKSGGDSVQGSKGKGGGDKK